MKSGSKILFFGILLFIVLILLWSDTRSQAIEEQYKIEPWITVPEYRTDAARAIDAYERLMERYMDVNEKTLGGLRAEFNGVSRKMSSIDRKLSRIENRLIRIERAVGTEEVTRTGRKKSNKTKKQEVEVEQSSKQ